MAVLARISTVNKQWRRLCSNPELYKHVKIYGLLPAGALQWLAPRAGKIESLSFSNLVAAVGCAQPPLHVGSFGPDPRFPKPAQFRHLFAPDPAAYMRGLEAVLQACTHSLNSILLSAVSSVFSQGILGMFARHSPNLKCIKLEENQFAGAHGGLCQIAAGCPLVERFSISEMEYNMEDENSSLNDNTMGELVFHWRNLRHFSVDRNAITLQGLCLLRHCENLQTLYIGYLRDCGDQFFERFPAPDSMILSRSVKDIVIDVPAITVSGTIRPLVLLCPNVEDIDIVHEEWSWDDDEGVLDNHEDLAVLQQEYPKIVFKRFGEPFNIVAERIQDDCD
ncbi:hypothetical protein KFL_002570120 [Klebsormidium nitens]|uniref:F-box domain-containing protein n=1 Tax=Klebsormidium nitens TaxID=105231 RepID=A0A1Y1I4I1_KLENI|nr:hypothetical protein KFL_002570120 [Klebsormidium nitens]|eukprot:GAQ85844.1 hypothetical protein KFL_002570120 [Klebsormidium nitens]